MPALPGVSRTLTLTVTRILTVLVTNVHQYMSLNCYQCIERQKYVKVLYLYPIFMTGLEHLHHTLIFKSIYF